MIIYANLMGGMISCQFPYLVLIFAGWLFAKLDLINKDGNVAFSKLSIEIFLPVYLFIQILRGTSVDIISKNYLIIISQLSQMLIGVILSLLYIWISKMDIRGRFSFIALACFNDIKKVHFLLTKTFCYHLQNQNSKEKEFCNSNNLTDYGYCHLFFQCLFLWYIGEYFLRIESKKVKVVNKMYELKEYKDEDENIPQSNVIIVDKNKENNHSEIVSEKDRLQIKEFYDNRLEGQPSSEVRITDSFYNKIEPIYMNLESTKVANQKKTLTRKILYSLFRAPIIAMFTGFVVGFITVIRTWVLRTDTAVYLFYDTFNSIGNSHIICGLLVVGSNLYIKEEDEYKHSPLNRKFTKGDFIAIISIKSFIMPFLGVVFALIAFKFIPDNRILIFTAFIQWLLPTTLDVISIVQAREINAKSMCIAVFIQWVIMTCLNNFIVLPAFLKVINEWNM